MDAAEFVIVPRACGEAEARALAHWSASFLPRCRAWIMARGLHPPRDVVDALRHPRFDELSISPIPLAPLFSPLPDEVFGEAPPEEETALSGLAAALARDLNACQALMSHAVPANESESLVVSSRVLRRFARATAALRLGRMYVAASELLMVPAFSPQNQTLYLPRWLVGDLPTHVFEPTKSFSRPRPASPLWLWLDAIVVSADDTFRSV